AQYMNSANVFNPSVLCETELDDAWNKFKAIYLAKKKMMISDFLFSQGYPVLDNDSYRIFIDPRRYITQQELGINPYETDPSKLQQQAQDKVTSMIDQNCRNYAAYWWSRFKDATACSFVTERDSAAIVDRLIAVCKEGGDETHPFGASTVKPTSTYGFKSFNETIL
ncbi:hypothetical protein, partial [Niastella vici]|uniref:hypothetical protein n=1 Tax=Niastella vici TaxID=1703345 RepID=UPI001301EF93